MKWLLVPLPLPRSELLPPELAGPLGLRGRQRSGVKLVPRAMGAPA